MQVTVTSPSELERVLTVTVPADELKKEYESHIRQLSKTRRIDGFRPGKAPASVIQKYFGATAMGKAVDSMIQINYFKAVQDQKLNPTTLPQVDIKTAELGKDFVFEANVEVYPEITPVSFENIEVERIKTELKDSDVEEMIQNVRRQQGKWKTVESDAQNGKRVVLNFVGKMDGTEFEGGKADNFSLVLGEGRMIPGFEDGIIGKKTGDKFDENVKFPEDYHAENLKGKDAVFSIEIVRVEELELPEVDDAFISGLGVKDVSLDGLKAELRKNMQRELSQMVTQSNQAAVFDALVKANNFTIPQRLVAEHANKLMNDAQEQFKNRYGNKAQAPEYNVDMFKPRATESIRLGMLIGKLVSDNKIEADDAKVDSLIADMASAYEDNEEVIKFYKSNKQFMSNIRERAVEQQLVDLVYSKAKVTDNEKSFADLVKLYR